MGRYYDTEEELFHYGVLGMKWGIRRYQPYSYTGGGNGKEIGEAARKGGRILSAKEVISNNRKKASSMIKQYKKKKQLQKARRAKAEKAAAKAAEEAKIKKLKEEITRDAAALNKNRELARKLLTNEEYDKIKNRLQSEDQVYELSKKKQDRARRNVEDILKYSSTAIKAYNQFKTWEKILNDGGSESKPAQSVSNFKSDSTSKKEKEAAKKANDAYRDFQKAADKANDAYRDIKDEQWFKDIVNNLDPDPTPMRQLTDRRKR